MENDNLNTTNKSFGTNASSGSSNAPQKPTNPTQKANLDKEKNDQNIKKLSEQLNRNDDDDDDDKKRAAGVWFKRILIILLIIILLAGVGVAIYFFTRNKGTIVGGAEIRLSSNMIENIDPEQGSPSDISIRKKEIYPGDKFPVVVGVRNSNKYEGDEETDVNGTNIYIRYKIALVLDGVEYYNVLNPTLTEIEKENWHIYNPDEEAENYEWDGYYYFYGSLKPQQRLTLFNEVQFSYENSVNAFGGKSAEIIITIEAVEANLKNIGEDSSSAWSTAPRRWLKNMEQGYNQQGNKLQS